MDAGDAGIVFVLQLTGGASNSFQCSFEYVNARQRDVLSLLDDYQTSSVGFCQLTASGRWTVSPATLKGISKAALFVHFD